jgi:hypothetical protein
MKPVLRLESRVDRGDEPFYVDGTLMNSAVAGEILEGPHKGVHIFSNRARAEGFCWVYGFEPEFYDPEPTL